MAIAPNKLKVSLTISADVIALVDQDARRSKGTRSGVVEQWLRRAAAASVEQQIEEATSSYYRSLRAYDREDDEELSKGLSAAARRVTYDLGEPTKRRRARR